MRRLATQVFSVMLAVSGLRADDWRQALPGWDYQFPRDHYAHPEFKTEWWYFTGHLKTREGRRLGYQITFFRQGLRPPGDAPEPASRFAVGAFHFAHFAISDLDGERFHFTQKASRGAFGEAGNGEPGDSRLAWIDDWELRLEPEGHFQFRAGVDDFLLELELRATKPIVINGEGGVSQKSAGVGQATHYYALTRMVGEGTLETGGDTVAVEHQSWLDREWGSNQLGPGQVGWDWFSLQLEDGRELMLYQMRLADGSADRHSSGTLTAADGSTIHLASEDFELSPRKTWKSLATGGKYPVRWGLRVPGHSIELEVEAEYPSQELSLTPVSYWEGAVNVGGSHSGVGYLEMTGYSAPLRALQR